MTLFLVLAALAAACLLWRLQRRKIAGTFACAVLAIVALVGCGPGAQIVLDGLQAPHQAAGTVNWSPSNAIVLLGAGTDMVAGSQEPHVFSYGRIVRTAQLYRDCARGVSRRCVVIVSGGTLDGRPSSEASVYARHLEHLGVPHAQIVLEDGSRNTWENARNTSALLRQGGYPTAVVVTSAVHIPRSRQYFRHFGSNPRFLASDYLSALPSWIPASYNFTLTDVALHEHIGQLRYHVYNRLGLNEPAEHE